MKLIRKMAVAFALFLMLSGLAWAKPNGVVIGYSAMWFDGIYPIDSYNFDAFTHIARSFLIPQADGSLPVPGGYFDPELEKLAHAHGVKLLVSIGGQAENANHWLGMARNPDSEKKFFDTLEKLVTDNHYDGVDIDWEPFGTHRPGSSHLRSIHAGSSPAFP